MRPASAYDAAGYQRVGIVTYELTTRQPQASAEDVEHAVEIPMNKRGAWRYCRAGYQLPCKTAHGRVPSGAASALAIKNTLIAAVNEKPNRRIAGRAIAQHVEK